MSIASTRIRSSKAEAEAIKSKLKLRFNPDQRAWELYTTIHGTGLFKWFLITQATKEWYQHFFPTIPIVTYDPKEK